MDELFKKLQSRAFIKRYALKALRKPFPLGGANLLRTQVEFRKDHGTQHARCQVILPNLF